MFCDESRSISGLGKGMAGRLIKDHNYIVRVNDWAHKPNLIIKAALGAFHSRITEIVQKISSHFNFSSVRRAKFAKVQIELKKEKILEALSYI